MSKKYKRYRNKIKRYNYLINNCIYEIEKIENSNPVDEYKLKERYSHIEYLMNECLSEVDNIEKVQYKNLRENLLEILVDPILGRDDYDYTLNICDNNDRISQRDKMILSEIKYKIDEVKYEDKLLKVFLCISLIVNIILVTILWFK